MKITLNRKKIYLEVFLQHINKICLRLFYVCCVVVVVVAVSVTIMFTLWSCLFYHTWSCHLLLWYLVVVGIVSIFVVVIVSFHFLFWCLVVVGISFHFLVWCMKVSRESSRAYMKLVWWIGD